VIAAQAAAAVTFPRLLVAIDSRRAELFVQLFDAAGIAESEPAMLAPDAVAAWAGPGPITLAGDGIAQLAPHFPAAALADLPSLVDPTVLARLAAAREAGQPPAPFYLRPPDAVPARVR
jgi:tRNA threonylcarbamoyladenosine biosynthesis protein TsaB